MTAADGLRARIAPPWTEEKLRILACYLVGFARACKSAGGWSAIDVFAGGGLNISKLSAAEIPGSPLCMLAAGPPRARRVVAAERDPGLASALRARVADPRAQLLECDGVLHVHELLAYIDRRLPAFAFLDPEGAELEWAAIRAIAEHKRAQARKIEQLILFPTDTGFMRLLALRKPAEGGCPARRRTSTAVPV